MLFRADVFGRQCARSTRARDGVASAAARGVLATCERDRKLRVSRVRVVLGVVARPRRGEGEHSRPRRGPLGGFEDFDVRLVVPGVVVPGVVVVVNARAVPRAQTAHDAAEIAPVRRRGGGRGGLPPSRRSGRRGGGDDRVVRAPTHARPHATRPHRPRHPTPAPPHHRRLPGAVPRPARGHVRGRLREVHGEEKVQPRRTAAGAVRRRRGARVRGDEVEGGPRPMARAVQVPHDGSGRARAQGAGVCADGSADGGAGSGVCAHPAGRVQAKVPVRGDVPVGEARGGEGGGFDVPGLRERDRDGPGGAEAQVADNPGAEAAKAAEGGYRRGQGRVDVVCGMLASHDTDTDIR
mmetsp:Transcript_1286/g.5244  ORF Transcript_1286/g.5244 Transcript_1286/m.5244 type:complete len:352 (-) Transcript_1286:2843-3898(-)